MLSIPSLTLEHRRYTPPVYDRCPSGYVSSISGLYADWNSLLESAKPQPAVLFSKDIVTVVPIEKLGSVANLEWWVTVRLATTVE